MIKILFKEVFVVRDVFSKVPMGFRFKGLKTEEFVHSQVLNISFPADSIVTEIQYKKIISSLVEKQIESIRSGKGILVVSFFGFFIIFRKFYF